MSDVFLSYSSADRDRAEAVATSLADAGLDVWWDRELLAGSSYARAIRAELDTARAVLVLWTAASVESDWVYSEARRGHERRAFVQARGREVGLDDLPSPFDALHCPYADDVAGLVRAVTALVRDGAPTVRRSGPAPAALPRSRTTFVGRQAELAELDALIADGPGLVTLVGSGGTGKTRLALEAARRAGLPAHFASLESSRTAEEARTALAAVVAPDDEGDARAVLARALARPALLVVDNCEHVDELDVVVEELLEDCAELVVLATSRRPLGVAGEQELPLGPLADDEAVELFVQRVRLIRRDFTLDAANRGDVEAICTALDRLPLAIELVAARSRTLSPQALRDRLADVLDVASSERSRPDRQRTLRATLAWSCGLLSPGALALLRLLGGVRGHARTDLAQVVAAELAPEIDFDGALDELAAASLASVVASGHRVRVELLVTTAAYAAELLEQAEGRLAVARAVVAWADALAVHPSRWDPAVMKDSFLTELAELEDVRILRSALAETLAAPAEPGAETAGLEPCALLLEESGTDGFDELTDLLARGVARAAGRPSIALVRAQASQARMHERAMRVEEATAGLALAEATLDRLPEAERTSTHARAIGFGIAFDRIALLASAGDYAAARAMAEDVAAVAPLPRQQVGFAQLYGLVLASLGELEPALEVELAAAARARAGGDLEHATDLETNAASTLRLLGRADEAVALMESAIPAAVATLYAAGLPILAEDYACILVDVGRTEEAARLWGAAEAMRSRFGHPMAPWQVEDTAASLERGRSELGERWDALARDGAATELEQLLTDTAAPRT